MNKGWSSTHAGVADVGLLVAGGLTAVAGATTALATAPAWLVVAGIGIVSVGVGDLAYQAFQENWNEDVDEHGWVGALDGVGHVFANTGKDMWHMVEDVGGAVKDLWNDVF